MPVPTTVHLALFLQMLQDRPAVYLGIVLVVIFSIVLHELAHGWTAIWQGDDTPIVTGHMTANPMVHMGPTSIILLLTIGIAWGLMPVNPVKFRSRYGDALVSAAGPVMTLLIALAMLSGYGVWIRFAGLPSEAEMSPMVANLQFIIWYAGWLNLALFFLNLLPVPPLDGSHILANFSPRYARAIRQFNDPAVFMFALLAIIVGLSYFDFGLFEASRELALLWIKLVSGRDDLGFQ